MYFSQKSVNELNDRNFVDSLVLFMNPVAAVPHDPDAALMLRELDSTRPTFEGNHIWHSQIT